jgi:predicted lipoprotein with Yx(FWY)xxD motif
MISSRRTFALLLLIPALVVAALAAVAVSDAKTKHKTKTLQLRSTSNLGRVLVDSKKRTLYMLSSDGKNQSTCSGACAANWPPAKAPKKPKLATGLKKKKLKVIIRSDGSKQLAYAGHPLYRFIGDSKPGDTNGEGINAFGGIWHALNKSGSAAKAAAPPPAPPSGYGY